MVPSESERILTWPDLRTLLGGVSRSWVWQEEAQGRFPKRIALGPRRIGWLASEVDRWLKARAAERFDPEANDEAKARRTPSIWARVAATAEGARGEG